MPKLLAEFALARPRLASAVDPRPGLAAGAYPGRPGLKPLDAVSRHDLLEIPQDRYGRRSTIVTSQVPVEHWHRLIGDPTYAAANLDRLVHNATRIDLTGGSLRRKRATRQQAA